MLNELKSKIKDKTANIGIIGLGYVGLPLAVEFAKTSFTVTGFDTDEDKISEINKGTSYILDVPSKDIKGLVSSGKLEATSDKKLLNKMDVIIICVPTPLRKTKEPDISFILAATEDISDNLRKGQLIVLESTTYPGTTEEVIFPKLGGNGLKVGRDLYIAFSPERVDPGNTKYKTKDIPKIVGGITEICTELARSLYSQIIKEVITVSNTRAAEMVKLLENTFRAVNIGLINELALLCNRVNLDIWEIIDAAKTKPFGFMPFFPGPGLGGHCLSEKEHLVVRENNKLRVTKIGDLFLEQKEIPELKKIYYKDVLFVFPKDLQVLSFDRYKRKMRFEKIHCLTERGYDGDSLRVKLKGGRVIDVTDRHPLFVQNGSFSVKLAKDLKEGEEIPLMHSFPEPREKKTGVDIIDYLINSNNPIVMKLRVEPKDFQWKKYRDIITPIVRDKYEYYHEYYRNNQIPFSCFCQIKDKLKRITSDRLYLCTGRGPSFVKVPAYINIDKNFCRLVGYYLSEGCVTVDRSARVRFTFNRDEREYVADVESILKKIGLRYSEYHSKKCHTNCIKVSSDIFGILMRDILRCGVDSKSMKIPDILLGMPKKYRANVLAGLLRGDGGVDFATGKRKYRKNNKEYIHKRNYLSINYFSSSDTLYHQVIFLMHSIGVIPTFKNRKNLLNVFGYKNIFKLRGLMGGDKDAKIDLYFRNKLKLTKSKIFKNYNGFTTARIKSISPEKLTKVYSLEVEHTNTFISSYGIISHNCLPCDPIYLSWKARNHGFEARLIELAAEINSYMPHYVVDRIVTALNEQKKSLKGSRILVVGVTYKKDINDIRESPALAIMNSLLGKEAKIQYYDPLVSDFQVDGLKLKSVELTKEGIGSSDCVVILTDHSGVDYKLIVDSANLIIDTRNVLKQYKGNSKIVKL